MTNTGTLEVLTLKKRLVVAIACGKVVSGYEKEEIRAGRNWLLSR